MDKVLGMIQFRISSLRDAITALNDAGMCSKVVLELEARKDELQTLSDAIRLMPKDGK